MLSFAWDKQFKDPHHVFKFLPKWMKRITSSSSPTTTTSSVLFKSLINVLFKYFEGFTGALKLLTLIIIEWIATPRIVCQTEWNICIITFPLFKLRKKVVTSPQFECIAHIFPVNLIPLLDSFLLCTGLYFVQWTQCTEYIFLKKIRSKNSIGSRAQMLWQHYLMKWRVVSHNRYSTPPIVISISHGYS